MQKLISGEIIDYAMMNDSNHVLFIEGPWGSGKTYLVKEAIKDFDTNKRNQIISNHKLEVKDGSVVTIQYHSLNGIENLHDLKSLVAFELELSLAKDKPGITTAERLLMQGDLHTGKYRPDEYKISLGIVTFGGKIKNRNTKDISNVNKSQGIHIIFFDDLERTAIPYRTLLGYMNDLTEHSNHIKVISIGNEESIIEKFNKEENVLEEKFSDESNESLEKSSDKDNTNKKIINTYDSLKEKTVGKTVRLDAHNNYTFEILKIVFEHDKLSNGTLYMNYTSNWLKSFIDKNGITNIRLLKNILIEAKSVIEKILTHPNIEYLRNNTNFNYYFEECTKLYTHCSYFHKFFGHPIKTNEDQFYPPPEIENTEYRNTRVLFEINRFSHGKIISEMEAEQLIQDFIVIKKDNKAYQFITNTPAVIEVSELSSVVESARTILNDSEKLQRLDSVAIVKGLVHIVWAYENSIVTALDIDELIQSVRNQCNQLLAHKKMQRPTQKDTNEMNDYIDNGFSFLNETNRLNLGRFISYLIEQSQKPDITFQDYKDFIIGKTPIKTSEKEYMNKNLTSFSIEHFSNKDDLFEYLLSSPSKDISQYYKSENVARSMIENIITRKEQKLLLDFLTKVDEKISQINSYENDNNQDIPDINLKVQLLALHQCRYQMDKILAGQL